MQGLALAMGPTSYLTCYHYLGQHAETRMGSQAGEGGSDYRPALQCVVCDLQGPSLLASATPVYSMRFAWSGGPGGQLGGALLVACHVESRSDD